MDANNFKILIVIFFLIPLNTIADNSFLLGQKGKVSQVNTKSINCYEMDSISSIVISGDVHLIHPGDKKLGAPPKTIDIKCFHIKFKPDSKLISKSNLKIKIDGKVYGNAVFESSRGQDGTVGIARNQEVLRARNGNQGGAGGVGNRAHPSSFRYPGGRRGGNGGTGVAGQNGQNGRHGIPGNPGGSGINSSNIYFRTKLGFANKNEEIIINSQGGNGGIGSKGGRGEDGGNGGQGGNGGKGGQARGVGGAGNGGNGANGGNGGVGGNGGNGGPGGNGGNGGQIDLIIASGNKPNKYTLNSAGGNGGTGGPGGNLGRAGLAGPAGRAGCGGSAGGIFDGGPGGCGGKGQSGNPGANGRNGVTGVHGPNGVKGQCIKTLFEYGKFDEKNEGDKKLRRESC
jgi:hypothetical protein